ncbi:hypothetical protein NLJ89_g3976 [Agrocybe chaxingu]|uniref:Uncharacterized protein n=1 Tax=Agrocybe chaxingu TaxID=84603 RepID=A0A9W8K4S3_9AGAR|nr:hypothetical protein NLJ89_g3976 [Agrocybe chaxingu]
MPPRHLEIGASLDERDTPSTASPTTSRLNPKDATPRRVHLCIKMANSSLQHVAVPFPKSYQDAVALARQIFPSQFQSVQQSDIVLKCGTAKTGKQIWSEVKPQFWVQVVENDDEILVARKSDPVSMDQFSGAFRAMVPVSAQAPAQTRAVPSVTFVLGKDLQRHDCERVTMFLPDSYEDAQQKVFENFDRYKLSEERITSASHVKLFTVTRDSSRLSMSGYKWSASAKSGWREIISGMKAAGTEFEIGVQSTIPKPAYDPYD